MVPHNMRFLNKDGLSSLETCLTSKSSEFFELPKNTLLTESFFEILLL
jgi:hypothetical protein